MAALDEALARLQQHEGLEHLLLLGEDGLLIRHLPGPQPLDADTVAALVPGVAAACEQLGRAADRGRFATAVLEYGTGIAVVVSLSSELLLALLLRADVPFGTLLRDVRRERAQLASLL